MAAETDRYDVVIIGMGAGGDTLAYRLAATGKKILILERGDFLPRKKANWSALEVYQKERYHTDEHWFNRKGNSFRPQTGYWVGGNTKVYGAALLRLRERDFTEVTHQHGISPAWEVSYVDFKPYYTQAEELYDVHGKRGSNPTEPPAAEEYPYSPVSHEPDMQAISDSIRELGYNPFHLPLGLKLNERDRTKSPCIRCDTFDGYPCLVGAKADAGVNAIRPAREQYDNLTLLTNAKVLKLYTNGSGQKISAIETEIDGEIDQFTAAAIGKSIKGNVGAVVGGVAGAIAGSMAANSVTNFTQELIQETQPTLSLGLGADNKPIDLPKHYSWEELQALSKPQTQ